MATILVVDDDPFIRSVVSRGLRFEGYEVNVAADALEALRIAQEQPLHLVVLDLMLPNLDGLEVCRRLRRGTNVPIIMLTARDAISDRIAGLDRGVASGTLYRSVLHSTAILILSHRITVLLGSVQSKP